MRLRSTVGSSRATTSQVTEIGSRPSRSGHCAQRGPPARSRVEICRSWPQAAHPTGRSAAPARPCRPRPARSAARESLAACWPRSATTGLASLTAAGSKPSPDPAPITRSGKKTVVLQRHIKNRRPAAVGPIWALASLRASPGARRHYDARRAAGDWNHQAQRHLFNKFLGQLHHCLQTGQLYDEHRAFPPPLPRAA